MCEIYTHIYIQIYIYVYICVYELYDCNKLDERVQQEVDNGRWKTLQCVFQMWLQRVYENECVV